ncbi:MFS transporter [Marinactinospora thermotolerans]|uniref:Predicted arabinose efflux permease, MFS family n=1 Tax=Marinactinospora thermotolerans DSM 45154 TaxID=1122192 RepID=A0A1T4K3N4_9ACTN|nr:MFS transporter [Marinactinospora thermotolerans]SJZ37019.1 Predicted arabinose efflux permease, MFS family [Marinactinospora thermotolerans DSM 45154]
MPTDSTARTPANGRAPRDGRRASLAFALGAFCVQFDSFALNPALPTIGADLNLSAPLLSWTVAVYLLACGSLMVAGGRLGDTVGHRRALAAGLALFGGASLLCGASTAGWALVAARALQGVGAALVMPCGLALVALAHPEGERSRATGRALGVAGLATALGPPLGGLLADAAGWRWVFLVNAPPLALALLCALRARVGGRGDGGARPGAVGVAALAGAAGAVMLLAERGAAWGWTSPRTALVAAVALLSAAVLWRAERRSAVALVPAALLRDRGYLLGLLAGAAANATTVGWLFAVPPLLQGVWGLGPGWAGTLFAVPAVAMALAGPVAGRLAGDRPVLSPLLFATGAGGLAVATLPAAPGPVVLAGMLVCCGAALGLAGALTLVAAQQAAPAGAAGSAPGLTKTAVTLAGAFGAAASAGPPQEALLLSGTWSLVAALAVTVALAVRAGRRRGERAR